MSDDIERQTGARGGDALHLPHMASRGGEGGGQPRIDPWQEDDRRVPLLSSSVHPGETGQMWMQRGAEWVIRRWRPILFIKVSAATCVCLAAYDAVDMFTWQSWYAIEVSLIALLLLVLDQPADLVLLAATMSLLVAGVITDAQAWSGFGSHGVLAIGVLFAVAKALEVAGTVEALVGGILGRPTSSFAATLQLCVPVMLVSAFVNDTPVVAMMMPVVERWCARALLSPSKLLLPMSFSAMLGGTITVIGSSTNLIVQDLILRDVAAGRDPGFRLCFFTVTPVSLPTALCGVLLMACLSHRLLPSVASHSDNSQDGGMNKCSLQSSGERMYAAEFVVTHFGHGKTPEEIGLMGTPGCASIVSPEAAQGRPLSQGDVVAVMCTAEGVASVRRMGFLRVTPLGAECHKVLSAGGGRRRRCLVEAVVSPTSPLIGCLPAEADTLTPYGTGILAVRRSTVTVRERRSSSASSGEGGSASSALTLSRSRPASEGESGLPSRTLSFRRYNAKEVPIAAGDTLLMESYPDFVTDSGASHHFSLVTAVPDSTPPRIEARKDAVRKVGAGIIFACCVGLIACEVLSMLAAALIAAYLLLWIQCITVEQAFRSVKGRVVLSCVAAYGLGEGLSTTHVTDAVAIGMVQIGEKMGALGVLFLVYMATACLSCIVSNQATAIILYSIARNVSVVDVTLKQLVVVIVMGASSSFMTPFGYQTNLMVWKPGGYQFTDFTKMGVPLTLCTGLLSAVLTRLYIVG